MLRSILIKEYYKIRWPLLLLIAANMIISSFVLIHTRRLFIMDHPEIVWYRVIHLGQINYEILKPVPLLTGIITALIQYLPEMLQQRMRLSLHLPVSIHALIFAHLLIGLAAFLISVLPSMAVLLWTTRYYFPDEVTATVFMTTAPWYLAGISAYLGGTLVLLEPGLKRKTVNMILAACVAGLFLLPANPGQYKILMPLLLIPLIMMIPATLLPAYRFRYRRVS